MTYFIAWTTGRASGPKMPTAPAKSKLTIGHHPSPVKTGSVRRKTTSSSFYYRKSLRETGNETHYCNKTGMQGMDKKRQMMNHWYT